MFNYNQSIACPHTNYCYGIAKLLEMLVNSYSTSKLNLLIQDSNFRDANSTLIDIHPILFKQVQQGLLISNSLIGTPDANPSLLYKLERSLAKIVNFKLDKANNLLCCRLNNSTVEWRYNSSDLDDIYLYCYYLRAGYTVTEQKGISYCVTEPLGVNYNIDNYSCSCDVGIRNNKCIHLQLIDWYRQSKLYGNSKRTTSSI